MKAFYNINCLTKKDIYESLYFYVFVYKFQDGQEGQKHVASVWYTHVLLC